MEFYEILKYEDKRIQALYDNMRRWELDQQALEEFLVGCKQKEKIFLTLEEESRAFMSLTEPRKETFANQKEHLGNTRRSTVRTEGDFLYVEAYAGSRRRSLSAIHTVLNISLTQKSFTGAAISDG